jgi:hypothetical protein
MDKMIAHVLEAYQDLPLDVCKRVWTTAQLVMNQVLLIDGGNDYKLLHAEKLKIVANHGRDMRHPSATSMSGVDLRGAA